MLFVCVDYNLKAENGVYCFFCRMPEMYSYYVLKLVKIVLC